MGKEYRAKVFKSGNSLALRLPKGLGAKEGAVMMIREEHGRYIAEPIPEESAKIDLTGIYGSIPGLRRPDRDDVERAWSGRAADDD